MPVVVLFIIFVVLLVIAVPVSITLGITSVLPSVFDPSFTVGAKYLIRAMFGGLDSFPLLAVPMFVLSGIIMAKGGISKKLFDVFAYFLGKFTAGMPCAVIVTCLFYGAISGSAPATVAAVGSMTIPILSHLGYDLTFSTAIVAVAGGLGVIIPPSIPFIMYGMASGASVSDLFLAGIIPGLMIGALLMLYAIYHCKRYGEDKEKIHAEVQMLHDKGLLKVLKESFFALLSPVIILGCIYSGICSPTEAAVISVIYGFLVCILVYKSIKIREIPKIFLAGSKTYVNILFVIAAASAFARTMTLLKYPQSISKMVLSVTDNKILILLLMNLIMIVCGMIIDNIPNIMILTPIMLPIANALGINPVHLGIFMTCNLAMGMVTPPMGINLFVASGMTKIPLLNLAKATVPFLIAFLVCLALIVFVPGLSLWLPSILG